MRNFQHQRAAQFGAAILLPFALIGAGPAPTVPIFSTTAFGWIAQSPNFQLPASGPHQVTQHPDHVWKAAGRGEAPMWRIADLDIRFCNPGRAKSSRRTTTASSRAVPDTRAR
jgi:hypothetical protein